MVQRLLLDRIDAETGRASVGGQHDRVVEPCANEALPALSFVQPAFTRAQVALNATVVEAMPPAPRGRLIAPHVAHAVPSPCGRSPQGGRERLRSGRAALMTRSSSARDSA